MVRSTSQSFDETVAAVLGTEEEKNAGSDGLVEALGRAVSEAIVEYIKGDLSLLQQEQRRLIMRLEAMVRMMRKPTMSGEIVERWGSSQSAASCREAVLRKCSDNHHHRGTFAGKVDLAGLVDAFVCEATIGPPTPAHEVFTPRQKTLFEEHTPHPIWKPFSGRLFKPTSNKANLHLDSVVPERKISTASGQSCFQAISPNYSSKSSNKSHCPSTHTVQQKDSSPAKRQFEMTDSSDSSRREDGDSMFKQGDDMNKSEDDYVMHKSDSDPYEEETSTQTLPSSSWKSLKKGNSMHALREQTEMDILARDNKSQASQRNLSSESPIQQRSLVRKVTHVIPNLILQSCGVLPFGSGYLSMLYTGLLFVIMLGICVLSAISAANSTDKVSIHVISLCLATGTFLGSGSLRWNGIHEFVGAHGNLLERYSVTYEFLDDWLHDSSWRAIPIALLWFLAVFARGSIATQCSDDRGNVGTWIPVVFYVVACGGFASLTYCQVHIASGLQLMVESWCVRYFKDRNANNGIVEWNTLQAVLRRTASIVETSIFLLQTCLLTSLGVVGVEALDSDGLFARGDTCAGLWGLHALLPMVMSLYAIFQEAAVTEKCLRVPSLLNSIAVDLTEDGLDPSCFKLVEYVTHSAAGFYVKDMRLTTFMVVKLGYILGAGAFALALHIVRSRSV